jgi:hypothetical protein
MPYWDRRAIAVGEQFPAVCWDKYHADILTALFALSPDRFDVVVGSNLFANTTFTPISLSWSLGKGFFTDLAFTVVGPDGSRWPSSAALGAVNLNPDYWTFAPGWAISYLDANWLLSANFRYYINTASAGVTMSLFIAGRSGFVDGNLLFGDFTALYKIGKWSFGPVRHIVN